MSPEALSRLAISKVVTFTSTYDHRIIQGAESGALPRADRGAAPRPARLLRGRLRRPRHPVPAAPLGDGQEPGPLLRLAHGEIEKQARVLELINAYRVRGHLIADIDPLRLMPVQNHPELDLETYGLTIWDLDRAFWTGGLSGGEHMPLREIIAVMRRVYCGKVGTEYRLISSPTEKYWMIRRHGRRRRRSRSRPTCARRSSPSSSRPRPSSRFLGTRFLGQRRYSIEGSETAIAVLDQLLEGAAARGIEEVTMGLTHRGRLNILANVVGNSAERIFAGFEGTVHPDFPADEGDVKYHQGARASRVTASGREIAITVPVQPLAPRGRGPRRRRHRARQAGPLPPAAPRVLGQGPPRHPPRRRGLRGAGDRRRGLQPRPAHRLPHRRHDPRRRQQPDRLHDRPRRKAARRSIRRTSRRSTRSRSSTSTATTPRRPTASCRSRSTTARSSTRTSSST